MIDLQSVYAIAEKRERAPGPGQTGSQYFVRFAASSPREGRGLDPDGFTLEVNEATFRAARVGDGYAIKAIPIAAPIAGRAAAAGPERPQLRSGPEPEHQPYGPEHQWWGPKGGEAHAYVLGVCEPYPEPGDRAACRHAFVGEYVLHGTEKNPAKKKCPACAEELA